MDFLIQIPRLIYAGAEKVLVHFANELVKRGHRVEILETYEKGLLKDQFDPRVSFHSVCSREYTGKYYASLSDIRAEKNVGRKAVKCAKLAFSKIVGYRAFAERLAAKHYKNQRYDVAINYLEIESPAFILKHIRAKKYLQWFHTDIGNTDSPEEIDKVISLYEKMDGIICVAKTARESFVARYPALTAKTHVIYNFFDVAAIREKAKEPSPYPETNDVILLSVGRMTSPKQYPRFLRILSRLKKEGYSFRWYVLGDGIQRPEIERMIPELDLCDRVFLEGLKDNPYPYVAHCDLFVLPSGWEGFPTVTVEAKILNCPVLATDVSGIREQMIHGKTGWIVENSEKGIYDGLKYLLDHPEVRDALRNNDGMEEICSNDVKIRQIFELLA